MGVSQPPTDGLHRLAIVLPFIEPELFPQRRLMFGVERRCVVRIDDAIRHEAVLIIAAASAAPWRMSEADLAAFDFGGVFLWLALRSNVRLDIRLAPAGASFRQRARRGNLPSASRS